MPVNRSTLDQARAGDEQAFRELITPHVGELRLHCYRMLGSLADAEDLARRFAQAFTEDDIDGVVALLTDDAWLAMPPAPHEYHGPAAVATFLRASASWRGGRHFRLVPCRANTQLAFGCYLPGPFQPAARATGVLVLTLSGNRIRGITRFLDDELPRAFGLSARSTDE